jgi:DNA polymerase III gamma/tau subunit
MNQEIINKLHTALLPISPLESDREQIIAKMGETIWLESLEKMLLALPEAPRSEVITLLNNDNFDQAVEMISLYKVDVDAIVQEVAESVMDAVIAQAA